MLLCVVFSVADRWLCFSALALCWGERVPLGRGHAMPCRMRGARAPPRGAAGPGRPGVCVSCVLSLSLTQLVTQNAVRVTVCVWRAARPFVVLNLY